MFARFFMRAAKQKAKKTFVSPTIYAAHIESLEPGLELTQQLKTNLTAVIRQTLRVNYNEQQLLRFASQINFEQKSAFTQISLLSSYALAPLEKRKLSFYFLALKQLADLAQAPKEINADDKRRELGSINKYIKNINKHLLGREKAVFAYEQYIMDRTQKNERESSLIKFFRNRFCEFAARDKIFAAREMIELVKNFKNDKPQLSDEAINALVNGKLGVLTQKHASNQLLQEIRHRYDPETNSYKVKGLEIVSSGRRYIN